VHSWHKKDPGGASRRGGSQQRKWKTRGQLSQQTNSPAPLQAEQRSSLSDGGEPWHGVKGGDKVELGGEYGNLKDGKVVVRIMCDDRRKKVVVVDGLCGGGKVDVVG
jgi:hypothetical protein